MRWYLLLLVLFATTSFAETSVWRISKGDNELFIGGTVHVLSRSDYPLPEAFDKAYQLSSKLVFETDIAASQDPAFAQAMMQRMMFTDGKTLQSVLRPEVYAQLEKYGADRGMPVKMLQGMRPAMVVLTLTFMELQRMGMTDTGVDAFYFQRAQADQKAIGKLESNAEQLDFIASMGKGRENDFVLYSLRDLKNIESIMSNLKSAWRNGESQKMAALTMDAMQKDFPKIYQQLLVDRNQNWLPKIEAMLNDSATEFILVGALHLVGDEGVLQMLRKNGYRIEQW